MKYKTLFKINIVLGLTIALYITIRGFISHGEPVCLGLTEITRCSFIEVLMQVGVLTLIAFIALTLIFGGIKLLLKKGKPKQKKKGTIKQEIKQDIKKEIKEETKENIIKI